MDERFAFLIYGYSQLRKACVKIQDIVFGRSEGMAVQFVLGADPNRKRKQMIDTIYHHLQENPDAEMIYLVPDNVKYEAEIMVLEQFKKNSQTQMAGMINLQIFSFSRLAWFLLQNKAIYQQPQLTESGLAMLMQKILKEEEENLTIYRGASQESGFIQRLITLFSEFRNGKISPDDLSGLISKESNSSEVDFKRKIIDLSYLYEKYNEAVVGSYLEREDLYKELIQMIGEGEANFKHTIIYIDHYEHFSAQELELLTTIAKHSARLVINLTITEESVRAANDLNNLFYRPLKTYHQLTEAFQLKQVEILEPLFIGDSAVLNVNEEHSNLTNLRNYWIQSSQSMGQQELVRFRSQSYEQIELWATEDIDAEVLHVATQIKRMVTSGKYRYKDFQIMTRDLAGYELSFEAIFNQNNLPFFIDQKETMAQHPLLEFIVSLFSLKKRYYRLDDIFRLLRTELFVPMDDQVDFDVQDEVVMSESVTTYKKAVKVWREKIDTTENVTLAFGYQGNDWIKDENWVYSRFEIDESLKQTEQEEQIEADANEVRAIFRKDIASFIESLDTIETNSELAIELYQFMEKIGVIDTLEFWRNQLTATGDLEEAEKHEQAWGTFISLLDEFVEVLGDEAWDIDAFLSIIETGFEQANYSMVPPAIDQVLVTNYDLPKIQAKKVVFLIGLTDTDLPKIQESKSLLTDEDREQVDAALSSDKYLAVTEIESVANEPFGFYLAMMQASEKIFFTYPLTNGDNNESRMSPYVERIQNALGLEIQIKYGNAISMKTDDARDYLEFIASEAQAFSQMLISLRHALDTYEAPKVFWVELFNKLYKPSNTRQFKILRSLSHKNIPVPLTENLAQDLYGKNLYLSVSQLESFYTDPYSHFLIYGLGLRERQIQELTPLESGNFYHDALDQISRELIKLDKDLAVITKQELEEISHKIFADLLTSNKYRLAKTSHRMNFIFDQLAKTVQNLVWSMVQQSKRSKFRPAKTELVFGQLGDGKNIQGLSFNLQGGRKLNLRGKIDRVDSFVGKNELFAGVVDYKSSDTAFSYPNIYHGLMLQMITYLDTVLTYSEEIFEQKAKGIGAFYSTVNNKYVNLQKLGQKDLELERLKNYQYDGLIVNRREVLEAADILMEPKDRSPIYNLYLKADDTYSHAKILKEEEFEWLLRFNREKIIEAGNQIISGKNTLQPFDKRQAKLFTPSVDGPYRAISQFDALLPENNYQEVKRLNKAQFFDYLKAKYTSEQEGEE